MRDFQERLYDEHEAIQADRKRVSIHDEVRGKIDKYNTTLQKLMVKKGVPEKEASARAFREIRKVSIRFRCMECGNLIPKNGQHCRGCGSYDIDVA